MKLLVLVLAAVMLLLAGCVHYAHPVITDRTTFRADLRTCFPGATPVPLLAGPPQTPPAQAAFGVLVVGSLAVEYLQAQQQQACMAARGYQVRGLTWARNGWKGGQ